jgi:hypothetical protein
LSAKSPKLERISAQRRISGQISDYSWPKGTREISVPAKIPVNDVLFSIREFGSALFAEDLISPLGD